MNKIYEILAEMRPEFDYTDSKDFIADGLLDSFDLISLVTELEEAFNILIDAMDIVPENFVSVEAIAAMVRKSGAVI